MYALTVVYPVHLGAWPHMVMLAWNKKISSLQVKNINTA